MTPGFDEDEKDNPWFADLDVEGEDSFGASSASFDSSIEAFGSGKGGKPFSTKSYQFGQH